MMQYRLKKTLLFAAALPALFACGSGSGKPDEQAHEVAPEKVSIFAIEERTVGRSITYPCTLNPFEEIYLAPAATGRIEKVTVDVGSRVARGQVIAQMDRTQLVQAEIQLRTLRLDYNRLDTLAKLGSVAKQQYDQIKGQYDNARTNVDFLRVNTQLAAPFAGVIAAKYFEDGELFSGAPGQSGKAAIVHLMQIDNLKAFVGIPEKYFPKVRAGMKVAIETDIYPGEKFDGAIFRIHPTIDPATHTFVAEIKAPNPGERLRPGMYTHISLEIDKDQALLAPVGAVMKLQGSNDRYVFVAENGKAKRVSVTPGRRFDEFMELISDEIKAGDQIIVKGQTRIADGAQIEIVRDAN
ncbi:MAG: efflux RND transporter periplasmic adaptor subunit [Prevotellaceae bacterium]|jgi:RND family efflux transporter MFP subunit|nr:efflux RND transporter periplasmic adaptor subunit [Prevotellaceae bacterium]